MINFISGLMIGGICGIGLMCLLQINRDNKAQRRIDKAIKYIKETNFWGLYDDTPMQEVLYGEQLLKILGGDVDDE